MENSTITLRDILIYVSFAAMMAVVPLFAASDNIFDNDDTFTRRELTELAKDPASSTGMVSSLK